MIINEKTSCIYYMIDLNYKKRWIGYVDLRTSVKRVGAGVSQPEA